MNEIVKFSKPQLPIIWNYETSIKFVSESMFKWKNLTEEVAVELYNAREMLSTRAWNKKSDGTKVPSQTWSEYCTEIGSSKQVVNRWLKLWFASDAIKNDIKEPDWFDQHTNEDIEAFTLRTMIKIMQKVEKDFGIVYLNEFSDMVHRILELGVTHINYKESWKQE